MTAISKKEAAYSEIMSSQEVRPTYQKLVSYLEEIPPKELASRAKDAEIEFLTRGVTYTVYGDAQGLEKIIPFDIVPRILAKKEWLHLESGLKQRVRALNAFLYDIYHEQKILKEKIIASDFVLKSPLFIPEMMGVNPAGGVYIHVAGIDIIRDETGEFRILEDNLRCPSGVSYVLENREVLQRVFPELFRLYGVQPVNDYPQKLLKALTSLFPQVRKPNTVILTPGVYNSAYFEHAFLAAQMGIPLVEGRDLVVRKKQVFMKTTSGLERVHVVYRRLDDAFMDPQVFQKDSLLGVPGIFESYRAGEVALANAIGNGVADEKGIYAFVPQMIRFYLKEDPILPNVKTYLLGNKKDRDYALANMDKVVIKEIAGSGGYGLLIGSHATAKQKREFQKKIIASPRSFIAQPIIQLSTHHTYIPRSQKLEPRHVDLRPYLLMDANQNIHALPGGLSRVALAKGALVVNSSQGGGGKDTWVLNEDPVRKEALC